MSKIQIPQDSSYETRRAIEQIADEVRSLSNRIDSLEAGGSVSSEEIDRLKSGIDRIQKSSRFSYKTWEEVFGGNEATGSNGIIIQPVAGSHAYVIPLPDDGNLDPAVLRGALIEATDSNLADPVRKFNLMGALGVMGPFMCSRLLSGGDSDVFGDLRVSQDLTVAGTVTAGGGISLSGMVETHGGTIVDPNGLTAAINVIVWRAPYACTVNAFYGYRVGGTGATVNARKNGSSNHQSSALSLTSANTWMAGGAITNGSYAAGNRLEIMLVSATGSPTQIGILLNFTRD